MSEGARQVSSSISMIGFAALAIGFLDAALVANSVLGAAGAFQYVPARIWAVAPLCWLLVGLLSGVPAILAFRNARPEPVVILMLALFVAVRFQSQTPRFVGAAVILLICSAAGVLAIGRFWRRQSRPVAILALTIGVAVLVGVVLVSSVEPHHRRAASGADTASPDVLIVFIDTVPFDSVFSSGAEVDPRMPFLAELARRSVIFEHAYTPSPWTLPAHFSAMTGLPAHKLGIGFDRQHYDLPDLTLAERFRRRGYRTAAVISNSFLNRGSGFSRGFESFEQAREALDVCRTAPGVFLDRWSPWFAASVCNWTAANVTERAAGYVDGDPRPLFLVINYMDAHDPYYVGAGCEDAAGATPRHVDVPPQEYRHRYCAHHIAALRCIDQHLGALAGRLQERHRETVFVVVGDHGEQFGEHGLVRHGNSLYARLLHVPLIISAPGIAPRRVTDVTGTEALPRLLGAAIDRKDLSAPKAPSVGLLVLPSAMGGGESWSLIDERWHLIQGAAGDQLFDLARDPGEERNLATTGDLAATLARLSATLADAKRQRVDTRSATFRSIGYIR